MRGRSIIDNNFDRCYLCGSTYNIYEHHVFYGIANRKLSEKYGLTIPLCGDCHTGANGVHQNRELDLHIKKIGQLNFEEKYSYELFMKVFGKNYR